MTETTADHRATKSCPDCAEDVLEAASKCRFCGFRFAPTEDVRLAPPPSAAIHESQPLDPTEQAWNAGDEEARRHEVRVDARRAFHDGAQSYYEEQRVQQRNDDEEKAERARKRGDRAQREAEDREGRDGATKDCPRCAEEIRAAALVCRYCQHEFAIVANVDGDAKLRGKRPAPHAVEVASGSALILIVAMVLLAIFWEADGSATTYIAVLIIAAAGGLICAAMSPGLSSEWPPTRSPEGQPTTAWDVAQVGTFVSGVALAVSIWVYSGKVVAGFDPRTGLPPSTFWTALVLLGAGGLAAALLTVAVDFFSPPHEDPSARSTDTADATSSGASVQDDGIQVSDWLIEGVVIAGYVALVGVAAFMTYAAKLGATALG